MRLIIAIILTAALAYYGYFYLHKGGKYNPHVININAEDLEKIGTETKRVCTFPSEGALEIKKNDYLKVIVSNKISNLVRIPYAGRINHVFAVCDKKEVDLSTLISPVGDNNQVVEACQEGSDCENVPVKNGAEVVTEMNNK